MKRRQFLENSLTAMAAAGLAGFPALPFASEREKYLPASDLARQIVKSNIVIDGLLASPWGLGWNSDQQFHDYMGRAQRAGITALNITIASTDFTFDDMLKQVSHHMRVMDQKPDLYMMCRSVADIHEAHRTGKVGIIFNSQSAEWIHYNLENLALGRQLGLSTVNLVYNYSSAFGDGSFVENGKGLTQTGRMTVDAIHKNRIVMDCSHSGESLSNDVARHTLEKWPGKPIIYSHSNAKGMFDHPRNITDEQIKLCAETGGVINPCFYSIWMGIEPGAPITGKDCADHIDYIVQLVGIDHVGVSTDDSFVLEPMEQYAIDNPQIIDDPYAFQYAKKQGIRAGELSKTLPAVIDSLMARGYTEEDCKKVIGGNLMNVYDTVWTV